MHMLERSRGGGSRAVKGGDADGDDVSSAGPRRPGNLPAAEWDRPAPAGLQSFPLRTNARFEDRGCDRRRGALFDDPCPARSRPPPGAGQASAASAVEVGANPGCKSGCVFEVDPERFEQMVSDALDSLPAQFAGRVDNVAFVVDDGAPGSPLLGLYEGIPLTKRSVAYSGVMPDRITIFRLPICARCTTEVEVREQVRRTVAHEVGHYFGIGDPRLRELGW